MKLKTNSIKTIVVIFIQTKRPRDGGIVRRNLFRGKYLIQMTYLSLTKVVRIVSISFANSIPFLPTKVSQSDVGKNKR